MAGRAGLAARAGRILVQRLGAATGGVCPAPVVGGRCRLPAAASACAGAHAQVAGVHGHPGQDPYHGPGQAEGLAFSVAPGVKLPPSLRNIFKERERDLNLPMPSHGSLRSWARQGILLLNTSLTVENGEPASHARKGWEVLTDGLLAEVAATATPCVYLLWGAHAQAKAGLIHEHATRSGREFVVLQANHPSPLSALRPPFPFIGCGHFGQASRWLAQRGVLMHF